MTRGKRRNPTKSKMDKQKSMTTIATNNLNPNRENRAMNLTIGTFLPYHRRTKISPTPTLKFNLRASSSFPPPPPPTTTTTGVVVIGAGLAGLAAATHLKSQNIPFLLLEASDAVGGRVRTDVLDGFLLDRGFQIFITAYPEAQSLLDYKSLNLQKFYSGAKIYHNGQFHTVADPLRHFADSLASLTNPIGSVFDKLLIALTRARVLTRSDDQIFTEFESPTMDFLTGIGFSDSIISRFFRPFFGGIFFDSDLETSSRLFNFIFKCLAIGENTLPANGIGAIPHQLATNLPPESILLNSRVVSVDLDEKSESRIVKLQNGGVIRSEIGVIVAAEEAEAERLLSGRRRFGRRKPPRSTTCLYFAADRDRVPVREPALFLNGSGEGIVNNMFFPTNVAPSYGPPEKALVSVSLIGRFDDVSDEDLTARVVREMADWFGESTVVGWRHLRTYRIAFAQPDQSPPSDLMKDPTVERGLYVCGDHLTTATFDGALVSGRKAVEALVRDRAVALV